VAKRELRSALLRLAELPCPGETLRVSDWEGREVTYVSIALAGHTGPWTPDDVEALPDSGDHARFEVFEGGVLIVSPAPGVAHQPASYWLHHILAQAAASAGIGIEVLEAVNVAMPGNKLLVPDVVVVAAEAINETATIAREWR
jgi:Uma2 family endonuclease